MLPIFYGAASSPCSLSQKRYSTFANVESINQNHWTTDTEFIIVTIIEPIYQQYTMGEASYVEAITRAQLDYDEYCQQFINEKVVQLKNKLGSDKVIGKVLAGDVASSIIREAEGPTCGFNNCRLSRSSRLPEISPRQCGTENSQPCPVFHTNSKTKKRCRKNDRGKRMCHVWRIGKRTVHREAKREIDYENAIKEAYKCHDYATIEKILLKALNVAKTSGYLDSRLTHVVHTVAATHCLERRYKEAERLYHEVLSIREKILNPSHPDIVDSLERLAAVVTETQGRAAAMTLVFRARCLAIDILPKAH